MPPGYRDDQGFALGNWVRNIRTRYRTGALTRKQIEELGVLGIVWNVVDSRWERCYAEAAAYYERYGNLEFPKHYVAESGLRLGAWLENQRIAYLKGELSADKAARLEAIGMLWEGRNDRQWQETYAAARRYFRQHGDLNVPYDYVSPEGVRLGEWVVRQRVAYKGHFASSKKVNRKPLNQERKKMLDAIGMDWREENSWQKHFEELSVYQKEHGSLAIPASYKTADGCWLSRWFYNQRKKLKETPEKLTPEQRNKLQNLLDGTATEKGIEPLYAG